MIIYIYTFICFFFCGIWLFSSNRKHLLATLSSLEFIALILYISIYYYLNFLLYRTSSPLWQTGASSASWGIWLVTHFLSIALIWKVNNGWGTRHANHTSSLKWPDDFSSLSAKCETKSRFIGTDPQCAVEPRDDYYYYYNNYFQD